MAHPYNVSKISSRQTIFTHMTLSPDHDTLVIQCTPHTFDNVWRKNSIVTIIFQSEWYICCYWLFLVYLLQITPAGWVIVVVTHNTSFYHFDHKKCMNWF